MASSLCNYAIGFLLAIGLETLVAVTLGYRKRTELLCVILVNVFSWPAVNYLVWIVRLLQASPANTPEILLFEAGVVVVEWSLLCYALPHHTKSRLFVLSFVMNGVSYTAGCLLPWL
jgi:hypothetical protein